MDGFIVLDKPADVTSHDMVRLVRRLLGKKKIGHTGTLDPFATGILPIAIGEGTKAIPFLDESVKEYRATMRLGSATDTQDMTGSVIAERDWRSVTVEMLEAALGSFQGKSAQIPPMYSALKRNGVPLYRYARRGEVLEREAREITVHAITLERLAFPDVEFTVRCSRGTYVRTLAHDLGERLGCGGHLIKLRRTLSGPFNLTMTLSPEYLAGSDAMQLLRDSIISPLKALSHLEELMLLESGYNKVLHGIAPQTEDLSSSTNLGFKAGERISLSWQGNLLAVAESLTENWSAESKNLRLLRVFNTV